MGEALQVNNYDACTDSGKHDTVRGACLRMLRAALLVL